MEIEALKILSRKISNISIYSTSYGKIANVCNEIETVCSEISSIDNKTKRSYETKLTLTSNQELDKLNKDSDYFMFIMEIVPNILSMYRAIYTIHNRINTIDISISNKILKEFSTNIQNILEVCSTIASRTPSAKIILSEIKIMQHDKYL